jgi:hypothetical protein
LAFIGLRPPSAALVQLKINPRDESSSKSSRDRTEDGAEIDLVLESGGKPQLAIEVKRASAPDVGRGFHLAADDLKIKKHYVVCPGTEAFPVGRGRSARAPGGRTRELNCVHGAAHGSGQRSHGS